MFPLALIIVPYFGKRKQVTYHLNLSYCCFHIVFTKCTCCTQRAHFVKTVTIIRYLLPGQILCILLILLLRDMLDKVSWYSTDISHLLPFAKVGQNTIWHNTINAVLAIGIQNIIHIICYNWQYMMNIYKEINEIPKHCLL